MAKIKSKGTKVQVDVATVLTDVGQVFDITAPGADVGTFDATALDSDTGREKEVTGFAEGGSLSFSLFFDPADANQKVMLALITTPAVTGWAVVWSDTANTVWAFDGILKSYEPKATLDDGLKADAEVELDGLVAYPA